MEHEARLLIAALVRPQRRAPGFRSTRSVPNNSVTWREKFVRAGTTATKPSAEIGGAKIRQRQRPAKVQPTAAFAPAVIGGARIIRSSRIGITTTIGRIATGAIG